MAKVKNIAKCSTGQIKQLGYESATFLIASQTEQRARYYGILQCHSTWACPKCTAQTMARRGTDIACAIDALSKQKIWAVMITFTIPHIKTMSCTDSFTILQNTWREFNRDQCTKTNTYKLKTNKVDRKNSVREYTVFKNPYSKFYNKLEVQHTIRAYEFTWGENSWHPHMHNLYFIPARNFKHILEYEKMLNDYWKKTLRNQALKYYKNKLKDDDKAKELTELIFPTKKLEKHNAITISKDKNGNPRKQESSQYVCGWSANAELTGGTKLKTAKDKHYTPFQMLEIAYNTKDKDERNKFLELFTEYAITTNKKRRIAYSKNLNQIIKYYKQAEHFTEILKKKFTDKAIATDWHVVYWFNQQQWCKILLTDKQTNANLQIKILQMATKPDAKKLINNLLLQYDIELTTREHPQTKFIEKSILNNINNIINRNVKETATCA